MLRDRRSFFERLTGAVRIDDGSDFEEVVEIDDDGEEKPGQGARSWQAGSAAEAEDEDGQLAVDVYQDNNEIVIKTMVAGVKPEDLEVAITRDLVTIKGKREKGRLVRDEDYFHQELYWGTFSRTIVLPSEIDPDGAEAIEKYGLLIVKLPKLDKGRSTKLRVKSTQ